MPVLIMGGILAGIFTPTEAAGILVVYSLIVGVFLKKELKWKQLPKILLESGKDSAMVLLLLALSEPFSWVIAVEQLPQVMITLISSISSSPIVVLLLINILLIIIGIPMETAPAIAIVTPVLAPIAIQMGIDPVHMGVIVCFNLVLGLITPPVGAVLFVTCGMTGMSLEKLSKGIWPPFFIALAVLLLITYVPALTTFLPNLLMK
jgi:C4-dicarboxylate transporter DctM subunit